jgi:isopentenyl diphosphate isomerase/L-lactate dehydrogenase-like FMN-dependent dehydrogenase
MSGTDVVKDLCFCAKAVGVERVALHGIGAGGVKGVERTFELHIMSRLAYIRIIISRD